jgi:predicted AAA+ superfamily ATPase
MIPREKYLNQLIASKDNGFPKVITGIRRCGKSYLLGEIYQNYLLASGIDKEDILYIGLDDDKNSALRDPVALGIYVRRFAEGKKKCYVFLDEVQRVFTLANPALHEGRHILAQGGDQETISFVDVVLGLSHENNIDLYVTGSNSKMLSSDIVTEFRDKATDIAISPLSFEEFYAYQGGSKTDALFSYMEYGGMPLAVLKESEEERREYLKGLFETTYFRDIVEHNRLRKSESLDELASIISSTTGSLLNSEKIADTFRSVKKEAMDKETVESYLSYFKDAFLLREAKRFDLKGRKEVGALRKYYFVDPGLRNAQLNFSFSDEGQLLENIVYNELIYEGYTVNVGCFDSIEKKQRRKVTPED